MKRITNKICAVLLSGIFMVMTGVNVNAAEQEYPPAEAVFPEEKVLQIENQIKNTPRIHQFIMIRMQREIFH